MEHLKIDSGAVTLAINGNENRTITFYPTDVRFAEDFFGLASSFMEKRKECAAKSARLQGDANAAAEELAMLRETYVFMRGEIDRVFGTGTSQTVFDGLEPYVRKARQNEIDRYLKGDSEEGAVMDA